MIKNHTKMKMIELIKPSNEYYKQYKEMMDEWNIDGSVISPWPLRYRYQTESQFNEMIDRVEKVEKGIDLGEYAPSTTYWLYDNEKDELLGASNLRHYLTEDGAKLWGHIGYGIRPSERRKGYATQMLNMTLDKAKKMKIGNVSLGAYTENIGSWKVMEKCGAKFKDEVIDEENGEPVKRYEISLKKRYAVDYLSDITDKTDIKTIKAEDEYFKGDIFFYNFIKVKEKAVLPNGKCIIDDNYRWLEFYDYSSKVKMTAAYDNNNKIIEWYFDIARKIGKENGLPYEDDMYLDVLVRENGEILLLDEDELKEALDRREISNEEYKDAYKTANDLMAKLKGNEEKLLQYTDKYLNKFLKG